MSKEELFIAADAVMAIPGVYLHSLSKFTDGTVSINKKGIIKTPIALDLASLESPIDDIRAAHAPHCYENKLVPMLCFIEPEIFMASRRVGRDQGIEAAMGAA